MNDHTEAFKTLHASALKLGTFMLAEMSQDQRDYIEKATKSGAKLLIELGPLPDCAKVEIVMLEREGKRLTICGMGLQ